MSAFDVRELRNAFGSFMTGITVVTAVSESGEKVGFTANSFSSVSIDPPLLLVCPAKNLSSVDIFNQCKHFAINILAEDQQHVSNTFAGGKGDRFAEVDWHNDENNVPLIDGAVAHFSCATHNNVDAGDHTILIGEVSAFTNSDKLALGYAKGGYFSLGMEHRAEELNQKYTGVVGALIEYQDQLLLKKTDKGYSLPQIQSKSNESSQATIRQYLESSNIDSQIGSVFSIYEDAEAHSFSTFYHVLASSDETAELGEFVSVSQLNELAYVSSDIESMLQRYAMEKQTGAFKTYVGDKQSGNTH